MKVDFWQAYDVDHRIFAPSNAVAESLHAQLRRAVPRQDPQEADRTPNSFTRGAQGHKRRSKRRTVPHVSPEANSSTMRLAPIWVARASSNRRATLSCAPKARRRVFDPRRILAASTLRTSFRRPSRVPD